MSVVDPKEGRTEDLECANEYLLDNLQYAFKNKTFSAHGSEIKILTIDVDEIDEMKGQERS